MEEKEGWILGVAQRHNIKMEDAVIEGLAEASQQIVQGDFNPFKGHNGENLPSNLERSFSGFLVRKDAIKLKVNTEMLFARIERLKDQLFFGKFVGPKPLLQAMRLWIQSLN